MDVLEVVWHGLRDSLLMAWEVWWALVLGFAISAIVQAWVPRERVERALSAGGPRSSDSRTRRSFSPGGRASGASGRCLGRDRDRSRWRQAWGPRRARA